MENHIRFDTRDLSADTFGETIYLLYLGKMFSVDTYVRRNHFFFSFSIVDFVLGFCVLCFYFLALFSFLPCVLSCLVSSLISVAIHETKFI